MALNINNTTPDPSLDPSKLVKIKDFDICDDADIDISCKANEQLLPNEPTFFNRVSQRVTQKAKDVYNGRITPMTNDQAIEAANSAIIWARKAYEWSKKDSIAGAQSAVEKIESIKSKLDASAKQYKEDMAHDTSLYKTYNPIYEQIAAISKKVDTALNFATAVVIIDTLRQAPEGIGKNVDVVNSLVISTLNDIKKMPDINWAPDDKDDVADNGVEEEKDADDETDAVDEQSQPVATSNGLEDMCNNKQKWEEYYKAARPAVEQPIEPDNAWQTEEQSGALCGHHALHNLFHKAWTKTACPPKNIRNKAITNDIYNEHLAVDEAAPITTLKQYNAELKGLLEDYNRTNEIDLYKICRINRRFILVDDAGTIIFRVDADGCENSGNYSPVIIRNALNIVGYPTFEINNVGDKKYTTEEYCKLIIDQFQSGNNLIGMILHTLKADKDPKNGHFIEIRKNNGDIEVIDTLYKPNPGSQAESAKLTLALNGDKDLDALANELNDWIGQAEYNEIYGIIGVFSFSGKYIPARLDQYSDVGALYQKYEETTGHDERYTNEAGNIFQKIEILFPPDQPTPKTDLIDMCKDDGAVDRNFSVETSEVNYVPIYMEDGGEKLGGRRSKKQKGGANPDKTKVESSVKDLYDIAMMLLNLNGELIEKSESQPSEQSDQSNLTNTLTILLNTRIPGKRNLLYKPQMTMPNTTSSQVWFDPRIKLKQSIVNNPQPLPPPALLPQSPRVAQNRYQLPNGYQQYNQPYNQPYNAQNRYQMPNEYQQYNQPYYNPQVQYGGGETPNERKEIYTQFFNRYEFNNLLLRTMNESPQQIPDLATAKEEGITDNNIQITLDTLFKADNVIYIEGAPYTIYAHDWVIGDWQIDTRPNIYIDSSTRFQLQAPTYTSYGVIIPKTSNIAIFEEQAKKERSEIPIALQRGDALEMTSKINKAIKSVLSNVAQNTKPRLTSAEIMKKASPWELAKLVERQMANRAYEPSLDERPNYVNVEPSSVAANAEAAQIEKVKAKIEAKAKAKADADAATKAAAEEVEAQAMQVINNMEVANKQLEEAIKDENQLKEDEKKESEEEAKEEKEAEEEEKLDAAANLFNPAEAGNDVAFNARKAKQEKKEKRIAANEKRKNTILKNKMAAEEAKRVAEEEAKRMIPIIKQRLPEKPLSNILEYFLTEFKEPVVVVEDNIESRLHEQFSNAFIQSAKMGFWRPKSIGKLINNKNNTLTDIATAQINLWKVAQKRDNTLKSAIIEIVSSIQGFNQNDINNVFINNPRSSDELKILKCEEICGIKFIIIKPFPPPKTPPSFVLNQRVNVETTLTQQEFLRSPTMVDKQTKVAGVIVKEKYNVDVDAGKIEKYNVLTDDFKPMIEIACNTSKNKADNRLCIQHADGFTIANIPTLETYRVEGQADMLANLEKCAFILYDDSDNENPAYRAIYKKHIKATDSVESTRQKPSTYIFDLNSLPCYLYYMIFLASYKFTEPVGEEFSGDFVVNEESPYIDNSVLNPSEERIRRNKKTQKMPDSPSPIQLKALNEFYTKRLSGSNGIALPKLPLLMGGSSQHGGGPEDDLVRAIETNDIPQIKSLLNDDASLINKTGANGNTMLMIACQNKSLGVVKTLLEMGAQGTINKQNAVGDTALHIACQNGYATIASVLVLNGADLTIKNVLGKTPIEVCDDPALKAKLELHLANVKKMFEFVKNNRTQDLRQLLETFRSVNLVDLSTGDTPLHIACQLGNKDIALLLLQCGANPALKNNNGQTPFDLVENKILKENLQEQYSLTQMLFNDVENDSLPEIEQILDRLPKNQVSILVNSRTNPESAEQGETPLHIAVKAGNKEMVKFLLDKGADPNIGDKYEATPLHFACRNGDGYIARMLVKFGGDLTIKAIDGRTPLDACKTNELRIDLIKDYIEKLARDKKLNLPKGSGLSSANDEESIKKALAYYLKKPNKIESKNSYYVVMDLDLYPGKSISTAQKARMQCSRVWDNIQEAWADSRGTDYVPKEQDISKALLPVASEVPLAEARPIRSERTRRRYGGKKSGFTRRCANKKCRGPKTRKHKRAKHKSNSRRVKK
jgi:ankyrin repeat protein